MTLPQIRPTTYDVVTAVEALGLDPNMTSEIRLTAGNLTALVWDGKYPVQPVWITWAVNS